MKEYIEREAVLAEAEYDSNFALVVPVKKVRSISAADVVEVVRCKDCKHFQKDLLFGKAYCDGRRIEPNDFCSCGERRGNDG